MAVIGEKAAWKILHKYAKDCLEIDAKSLMAVVAIGSLPGGYYRPGESDIDAILIVADGSEAIWGDVEDASPALEGLNRRYSEVYNIPKDFGPFPIQERQLKPPYPPEKGLASEIARCSVEKVLKVG